MDEEIAKWAAEYVPRLQKQNEALVDMVVDLISELAAHEGDSDSVKNYRQLVESIKNAPAINRG